MRKMCFNDLGCTSPPSWSSVGSLWPLSPLLLAVLFLCQSSLLVFSPWGPCGLQPPLQQSPPAPGAARMHPTEQQRGGQRPQPPPPAFPTIQYNAPAWSHSTGGTSAPFAQAGSHEPHSIPSTAHGTTVPNPEAPPPPFFHPYLYIVSASTSPNQTLRCAWKCSPCTSSMATSPPPVSCGGSTLRHRLLCPVPPPHTEPQGTGQQPHRTPTPRETEQRSPLGMEMPQKAPRSQSPAYLQGSDERHGADRLAGAGQALTEGVLHHLGADDGPAGAVVQ